jgi:hypothetical protein
MGDAYGAGVIHHVSSDLDELLDDDGNESIKNGNANGSHFHVRENGITNTTTF